MNIPIPQDIPGLITFWIFLSWIPLLRAIALSVMSKYPNILEQDNEDLTEKENRIITIGTGIAVTLLFWVIITASLLGLRLLIQMLWC
jgi:hypothetical protein